ncbi:MAG: hypothetical protein HFJ72_05995 [Adlercreutzia sp.]|nr:hypothetical protein [Adlercreutzia sp.]
MGSHDLKDDASERRQKLFFPRSLNAPTRLGLWLRGFADARAGKVSVSAAGCITSPYCKTLVEVADLRIHAEWQETNGLMFELRPPLEKAIRHRDELLRRLAELPKMKATKIATAQIDYPADAAVSENMAERRRRRRLALIDVEFSEREKQLREELNGARSEVAEILASYQDVLDVSKTHERLVRIDYLARLSCYARGASRRVDLSPQLINDAAVTTLPHDESEQFFAECLKGGLADALVADEETHDVNEQEEASEAKEQDRG